MLPSLSLQGILYVSITRGLFNGSTFKLFLEGLLECMNPYPGPNSVLVIDNCAIHHVEVYGKCVMLRMLPIPITILLQQVRLEE